MKHKQILKLVLAALFLAAAVMLPQATMRIQTFGRMLLPMHLPVLICGFICGARYGALSGALAPLICAFIFPMPPLYPTAVAMAFELCAYGLVCGLLSKRINVYAALVSAMLCGRIVSGAAMAVLLGMKGGAYGFSAFIADAFVNAWPGILIQIALVPLIVAALKKIPAVKEIQQ